MQTPDTYPFTVLQALAQKNRPNGYAGLDNNSKIPISNIPALGIDKIADFSISSLSNNQILQYSSALSKWINATLTNGSSTLATLTDCSVSSPSNDQILVFTTASSLNKWTPYTISGATFNDTTKTITVSGTTALSGLTTDVTISSPANNQVLQYNSTLSKWVNSTLSTGSSTLATLTDCSVSSPSNDQILVFTTASSLNKWTPYTLSGVIYNNEV